MSTRPTRAGRLIRSALAVALAGLTGLGGVGLLPSSTPAAADSDTSFDYSNSNGQTVVVTAADGGPLSQSDGRLVVRDGARLRARISGLSNGADNTATAPAGFYLMTAVDNGPGRLASPAIGGIDLEGETGQSQWLTNHPYAGSEDIVVPIAADNTSQTDIGVVAADQYTDCRTTPNGCVLNLRTDHRSTANRAFDVRIPLTFASAPQITTQPADVSVRERATARFTAAATGTPIPAASWESQRNNGSWTAVDGAGGSTLTIAGTTTELDGTRYRAVFGNAAGVVRSQPATLTVTPRETPIEHATFEWAVSDVWQAGSPNGSCNYFIAGKSDGTDDSYKTRDGDVWLIKRLADGAAAGVAKASRCDAVEGSNVNQRALFTNGTGTRDPETGEATVLWDGAVTVNSYGGLVPWYIEDPRLTVNADGTGRLVADVGGYASSIGDPNHKEPLPPVEDVVVADLANLNLDSASGFATTPAFEGIDYFPLNDPSDPGSGRHTSSAIPDSAKNADPHWGSWPESFVDFQYTTGLSSYWHTSGLSADPKKPPLPVRIAYDAGTPPLAPTIVNAPDDVEASPGRDATVSVEAQGSGSLRYQWQRQRPGSSTWDDLAGAPDADLRLAGVSAEEWNGAKLRVLVSNAVGTVPSRTVSVTVADAAAPTIGTQPASLHVLEGGNAFFSSAVSGYPTPVLQWQHSTDGGQWQDWEPAGSSSFLQLTAVGTDLDGRRFRLVATNGVGEPAVSAVATLRVTPIDGPTVVVEPAAGISPDTATTLRIQAGGFNPAEGAKNGVHVALVNQTVWQPGQAPDLAELTLPRTETPVTTLTSGGGRFGTSLQVPAGTLDPSHRYGIAVFSQDLGDRSFDGWAPIHLLGQQVWEPKIEVVGPDGGPLGKLPPRGTTTVTVKGTGFDPSANPSDRPPVPVGEPAGVYLVFGAFANTWKPSEGAGSEAREVFDQKWVLPDQSRPGEGPEYVTLRPDGSFETTLEVSVAGSVQGTYGIVTYAAGGAPPNATQELFTPVLFGNTGTPALQVSPRTDLTDKQLVDVIGSGYAPHRLLYVAQTPQGESGQSNPSPFTGAQRVLTDREGAFTARVKVSATFRSQGNTVDCVANPCHIASFSSPLQTDNTLVDLRGDRTQDVFQGIAFGQIGPQPTPPAVTTHPEPLSVAEGQDATFRAAASGTPEPTVQWESSTDGETWQTVSGQSAITPTLQLTALPLSANGTRYRAVFSNEAGSAASQSATLTVTAVPDPPSVTVEPNPVRQGETATVTGRGFGPGEQVTAGVDDEPGPDPEEFTYSNGNGQSLTIGSADGSPLRQEAGKLVAVDGAELRVRATGLTNSADNTASAPSGFYLMTAVDNGPGELASPAIGGVDLSGSSGYSRWVTNFPYPGSENIVVPIEDDRTATATIAVVSADDYTDCSEAPNGCVFYLRTDHRSTANRAFDVRVPLDFISPTAAALLARPDPVVAKASATTAVWTGQADEQGEVRFEWTVPTAFPLGEHGLTLTGASGTAASAGFVVSAAGQPTPSPTPTPTPSPSPGEASVTADPSSVRPGEQIAFQGRGFGADEQVRATVRRVPTDQEYTFGNGSGQTLKVSSADTNPIVKQGDKLAVVNRGKLRISVSGLTNSADNTASAPSGFYLMTAVDNGPGRLASPAIGGVDLSGGTGLSQWLTNVPYPGSEEIVVPIDDDGTATTELGVVSADQYADCTAAAGGCVLYLRTDHRSTANRAFDVRVPLAFFDSPDDLEAQPVELPAARTDGSGNVTFTWQLPDDAATGRHTVTLAGETSQRTAAARFEVALSPSPSPSPAPGGDGSGDESGPGPGNGALAETGASVQGLLLGAGALVVAGAGLMLLARRRRRAPVSRP